MDIGRKVVGIVLLVLVVTIFCWSLLLSAGPTGAQTPGDTTSDTTGDAQRQANQSDEGCSNPQVVETFSGTENQRTPQFQITGSTFRLSYDVEVTDPNGFPVLDAEVLDDSGQPIGEGFLTFEDDGSQNILAGPGTFSLEISADGVEYTVTVEDCGGNDRTTGGGDGSGGNVGITERRNGDVIINVPEKPLPPTGGLPVSLMVGGFILAGAGLLAWSFAAQRGRQR